MISQTTTLVFFLAFSHKILKKVTTTAIVTCRIQYISQIRWNESWIWLKYLFSGIVYYWEQPHFSYWCWVSHYGTVSCWLLFSFWHHLVKSLCFSLNFKFLLVPLENFDSMDSKQNVSTIKRDVLHHRLSGRRGTFLLSVVRDEGRAPTHPPPSSDQRETDNGINNIPHSYTLLTAATTTFTGLCVHGYGSVERKNFIDCLRLFLYTHTHTHPICIVLNWKRQTDPNKTNDFT